MKIAVVGSREFKEKEWYNIFCEKVLPDLDLSKRDTITDSFISGGARGIDSFIEKWCNENQVSIKVIKPDWEDLSHPDAVIKINKFGKKYDAMAGKRRNKLIINEADRVIAFWDGESQGTEHSIDLAIKAGKPIDIYVRK